MARVLWAAEYHLGCTPAAVPAALELVARGHEVVMLAPPEGKWMAERWGFGHRPNRRFPVYDFSRRETAPVTPEEELVSPHFWSWWEDRVDDQMADVGELLGSERFDLVLSKSCMMLCGAGFAAQRAGVPWVSYVNFCIDETAPVQDGFVQRWNRLRNRVALGADTRPAAEAYWYFVSPELTLLIGIPGLQHRASALPPYVHAVGPMGWDPPLEGDVPAWLVKLGRDRPGVLLSISSLAQGDEGLLLAAAEALADQDVDVVATVRGDLDLPALPDNFVHVGAFPHAPLMERVSSVVCSAGFGSTTRAVMAGIPPVVVPHGGDGRLVARAVVDTGVGIAIDPSELSPERLWDAVERTRSDPHLAEAAGKMASRVSGMSPATVSADLIEALLPSRSA